MADEDKAAANEEESAAADAARAETDPESVVEPSNEELNEQDAADEDFAADLRDDSSDPEPSSTPEPVGAVSSAAGGAAAGRSARGSAAVARKDRPTAKRDVPTKPQRTGPVTFVKESVAELRKVVYPTATQLGAYFVAVLVFVLFIILVVGLLDLGFGSFIFWLFAGA